MKGRKESRKKMVQKCLGLKYSIVLLFYVISSVVVALEANNNNNNNNVGGGGSSLESPQKVLSRKRRFVYPSDSGWIFIASFSLSIPLTGDYGAGNIAFTAPFTYVVDTGVVTSGKKKKKRAADDLTVLIDEDENYSEAAKKILQRESQRLGLIGVLEEGFAAALDQHFKETGLRGNGKECALRILCEVAETPRSETLMGEVLHLLLTPKSLLKRLPKAFESVDYIRAQMSGALHNDCSEFAKRCEWSLFETAESYIAHNNNNNNII